MFFNCSSRSKFGRSVKMTFDFRLFCSMWSMQSTVPSQVSSSVQFPHPKGHGRVWRTRYGDITLPLGSLRVAEYYNDLTTVFCSKNPQVLADSFFSASFGLGLSNTGSENDVLRQKTLLEGDTIWQTWYRWISQGLWARLTLECLKRISRLCLKYWCGRLYVLLLKKRYSRYLRLAGSNGLFKVWDRGLGPRNWISSWVCLSMCDGWHQNGLTWVDQCWSHSRFLIQLNSFEIASDILADIDAGVLQLEQRTSLAECASCHDGVD